MSYKVIIGAESQNKTGKIEEWKVEVTLERKEDADLIVNIISENGFKLKGAKAEEIFRDYPAERLSIKWN